MILLRYTLGLLATGLVFIQGRKGSGNTRLKAEELELESI